MNCIDSFRQQVQRERKAIEFKKKLQDKKDQIKSNQEFKRKIFIEKKEELDKLKKRIAELEMDLDCYREFVC